MKDFLILLVALAIFVLSFIFMYGKYQESMTIKMKADKCTAELIAQGIERKNIVRLNGVCFVK